MSESIIEIRRAMTADERAEFLAAWRKAMSEWLPDYQRSILLGTGTSEPVGLMGANHGTPIKSFHVDRRGRRWWK